MGFGSCEEEEEAANHGQMFRGITEPPEGLVLLGLLSLPLSHILNTSACPLTLLPTTRLSYTRTPTRRSSCLSECQVSSQDPSGAAQLEVLAVTELGVAMLQT